MLILLDNTITIRLPKQQLQSPQKNKHGNQTNQSFHTLILSNLVWFFTIITSHPTQPNSSPRHSAAAAKSFTASTPTALLRWRFSRKANSKGRTAARRFGVKAPWHKDAKVLPKERQEFGGGWLFRLFWFTVYIFICICIYIYIHIYIS